jgi:hypothetical protein
MVFSGAPARAPRWAKVIGGRMRGCMGCCGPSQALKFGAKAPMIRARKGGAVAWIRASCPTCGDVELSTAEVQVLMCSSTSEGSYVFHCPTCQMAVSKPAEPNVIDVLVASGVRLSVWRLPAELDEDHHGPPIGYDDLLDFHFRIERDDWVEALERMDGPGGHRLERAGPSDSP